MDAVSRTLAGGCRRCAAGAWRRGMATAVGAAHEPPRRADQRSAGASLRQPQIRPGQPAQGPRHRLSDRLGLRRAGLPLEVIKEFEGWRQVRDADGATRLGAAALLTGRRTALVLPWEVKPGSSDAEGGAARRRQRAGPRRRPGRGGGDRQHHRPATAAGAASASISSAATSSRRSCGAIYEGEVLK